jgi:hypothetical protein
MTSPTLFDDMLPHEHTETQAEWAERMQAEHGGLGADVLFRVDRGGHRGVTPWEVVHQLGLPEKRIVAVRAVLTTTHQAGDLERIDHKRNGEYVYVAPWAWRPVMGRVPSKPHHGRGSL